jgi:protein-tyrosine phosphatase
MDTTCDLTAGFSSSVDTCLVTFTDTSTGDLLYDWLWDFGDGDFSTLENPTHGYAEPGTYTVTLWVSNECGSYDFISHDVTVSAESVAADFTDTVLGNMGIPGLVIAPKDGTWAPTPDQIARFLQIVRDPTMRPLYVHCQHGVDRTGAMMAVYRMEEEGWSNPEAYAEMEYFDAHRIWQDLREFVRVYRTRPRPVRLDAPR